MATVGIIGASGYTGAELLRLLAVHPQMDLKVATGDTQAGTLASLVYPSLAVAYPDLVFQEFDETALDGLDVVFLGLPHEASMEIVPRIKSRVGCIVDLSAAYRMKDASLYPTWYGFEHTQPEELARAVYGLPELHREALRGATLIATPGCYVTAATLALYPLLRDGIIHKDGIIVDAASGVSGAGRSLKHSSMFSTVDEDFSVYGLLDHRHTPEIESNLEAQVLFTPHLAPMNRGILATCYARPEGKVSTAALLATLARFYRDEPFVSVGQHAIGTKATLGSNAVHITARYDERTGTVIVLAAEDNLTKGASGGAVQSANVALGLPEAMGLSVVGMYP